MVTRQNIPRDSRNPVDHVPSGYEGSVDTTFYIPSCGIEDADTALVHLYDKEIGFAGLELNEGSEKLVFNKPFVIFAVGERFAVVKKLKPPRTRNGALLLPAISIRRTNIEQTAEDITGRGMNQHTGELVIKTRLDKDSDRNYQALLNKLALKNMVNLPTSRRTQGENEDDTETLEGAVLQQTTGDNIYETIVIPTPQFFTSTYEIIFWTTHTQHMIQMIEAMFASFLPFGKEHKLTTDKGYWFMAYTEDTFSNQDNFEEYTDKQRMVRYGFTVKVKGYILAPNGPNQNIPIRKYISCPQIDFTFKETTGQVVPAKVIKDKFAITDIENSDKQAETPTTQDKFLVSKKIINPVTGQTKTKYVKMLQTTNQRKGETSYYASDIETLEEFFNKGS